MINKPIDDDEANKGWMTLGKDISQYTLICGHPTFAA